MDSTVSSVLALQARRALGRPPRWMEQLKMERLRQVNGAPPRLSPTPPPPALNSVAPGKGWCEGRPWAVSELGSTELTVLSLLRDRRDSSGSAASSAYLSSSLSPCLSSRRSSQGSTHQRPHNLSSSDSYDPISTDASRRSSEASQCGPGLYPGGFGLGGSRGSLNLTPAQHYHLKAKYAAATGGPPPTPLPNMLSLKSCAAVEEKSSTLLPPLLRPQRCTDPGAHRRKVFYPGEGPQSGHRRASDPVRTQPHDPYNSAPLQRFNSLNNLHPLPPLPHHPRTNQPRATLPNHPRAALPNHPRETLPNHSRETLPRAALSTHSRAALSNHSVPPLPSRPAADPRGFSLHSYSGAELSQSFTPSIAEQAALEALAMEDEVLLPDELVQYLNSQAQAADLLPLEETQGHMFSQQQQGPDRKSPSSLPIQWNEVSSGSAELSPHRGPYPQCEHWGQAELKPFGRFSNMMVQQQSAPDFQSMKTESSPQACMELRGASSTFEKFSQVLERQRPNFKQQCLSQRQSNQQFSSSCHHGNNLMLNRSMDMSGLSQSPSVDSNRLSHVPRPPVQGNRNQSVRSQFYSSERLRTSCPTQPQGPPQGNGVKVEVPDDGYLQQGFRELPFESGESKLFQSMSECGLSPSDQVSSSVDAGVLDEAVSLDLAGMLEDYDQGSLVSGLLSPSMFQGLSRTSSRLTTPHGSTSFPPVAPGLNNMAIGDMSSLLTSLAEESKFLAIM